MEPAMWKPHPFQPTGVAMPPTGLGVFATTKNTTGGRTTSDRPQVPRIRKDEWPKKNIPKAPYS